MRYYLLLFFSILVASNIFCQNLSRLPRFITNIQLLLTEIRFWRSSYPVILLQVMDGILFQWIKELLHNQATGNLYLTGQALLDKQALKLSGLLEFQKGHLSLNLNISVHGKRIKHLSKLINLHLFLMGNIQAIINHLLTLNLKIIRQKIRNLHH